MNNNQPIIERKKRDEAVRALREIETLNKIKRRESETQRERN